MSSSEPKVVEGERALPAQGATRLSRIVDRLTLRKELAAARSDDQGSQNEARRAQEIARTADHVLDAPDGTACSPEVAVVLFREATHWLLQAAGPEVGEHALLADALASAREQAAPQTVEWLSAHPLPRAMAASRLEFAGYAAESQLAEARVAQRWLHALLGLVTAKHDAWQRLRVEASQQVGRVEVRNRSDGEQARAVPLVVEPSSDGKHFQPVAKITKEFDTWNAVFPRQAARYVRLRVARTSMLHLERVSVRR